MDLIWQPSPIKMLTLIFQINNQIYNNLDLVLFYLAKTVNNLINLKLISSLVMTLIKSAFKESQLRNFSMYTE